MRFLRMLTNSLLAGALGAAYLTIVVLQLNPHVPLLSMTTARLYGVLVLFYGVHLAAIFYLLMVGRELVSLNALSPGWVSVRVLAWLAAASALVASALMWLNLDGFTFALDDTALRRMSAGAAATTATAIVLLGLAAAHFSFGRRGSRVGAALLTIAIFGSIALPVAARGPGVTPWPDLPAPVAVVTTPAAVSTPRVVMILLDGASLEYIWPRAAAGRLPNFARLLENGAAMDLATVRPTGPEPVWAAAATGMYPAKNGVRGSAVYYARGDDRPLLLLPDHCFSHVLVHLGLLRSDANSSASLRARPLWSILAHAGVSVGIVRWPLTYPTQPVNGFLLSDRFHELLGSLLELDDRAAFPADAISVARQAFTEQDEQADPVPAADVSGERAKTPEASAHRRDRLYSRAMGDLGERWAVQVTALRYQGLDTVGHYNLRYTQPREFGDLSDDDRRRGLQAIDRYYAYIDGEVGQAVARLAPGDLLLVISGFGMQPPSTLKYLLGRVIGDPMSGTHERAPDGFLLAYGDVVQRGRRQRGAIVDVTPTVLYFLGLPVGRDMDGYARADLFRPEFAAGRPVAFIPSHNR
ncbi:MAG TPA: alkaline phosphatase family protein [Vicinamibacterales bacterium]|nr:alkaline phosphatase family protein [Vicinamibacterales bacterium]